VFSFHEPFFQFRCLTRYAPRRRATRGLKGNWLARLGFSATTLLATEGTAFYNPLKTAKEAVVSFTNYPGIQPL